MGKIFIGKWDKIKTIRNYTMGKPIKKIYVIGKTLSIGEHIEFKEVIMYRTFYRLLQEINKDSLVILNECLQRKNRYCLEYNCMRRYCLQTPHVIVFNYYPIISNKEDFMILYDMIQENPFMKEAYRYVTRFTDVEVGEIEFNVVKTDIVLSDECVQQYEKEKEKIIQQVKKDPDIIPRRLLKFSESKKPKGYDRLDKVKPNMRVAVSQLKVDSYYYGELMRFKEELQNVIQAIHG